MAFNGEFEDILLKANAHAKRTGRDVHRGPFAIKFKGPRYKEDLKDIPSLINELIQTSMNENTRSLFISTLHDLAL